MKINHGPSAMGLQHMAARAQEVRQSRVSSTDTPSSTETLTSGNNVSASGESLPPTAPPEETSQQPDHTTGLERAIEMLQQNTAKSPEAKGLQQALEMLMRNQERTSTVDVEA